MALTSTTFEVGVIVRQRSRSFKRGRATNHCDKHDTILGDPGADSGDEGKSKRAEKYS